MTVHRPSLAPTAFNGGAGGRLCAAVMAAVTARTRAPSVPGIRPVIHAGQAVKQSTRLFLAP